MTNAEAKQRVRKSMSYMSRDEQQEYMENLFTLACEAAAEFLGEANGLDSGPSRGNWLKWN